MSEVKDIKEAVSLMAGLVVALQQSAEDGEFDLSDLQFLVPISALIQPAVEGAGNIASELRNMNEQGEAELKAHIEQRLGEGAYEMLGEDLLLAAAHLVSAYAKARKLKLPTQ